jgi:hypothetical protein
MQEIVSAGSSRDGDAWTPAPMVAATLVTIVPAALIQVEMAHPLAMNR